MRKFVDLTGKRFGMLKVLEQLPMKKNYRMYLCRCDCGIEKEVYGCNLTSKKSTSCGCAGLGNTRHGFMSGTPEQKKFHRVWKGMRGRCLTPTNSVYPYYGGRGIKLSERWNIFENFRDDMWSSFKAHAKKHGLRQTTIDRIDPDGNYCLENCRWANYKIQRLNQRSFSSVG